MSHAGTITPAQGAELRARLGGKPPEGWEATAMAEIASLPDLNAWGEWMANNRHHIGWLALPNTRDEQDLLIRIRAAWNARADSFTAAA